MQTKREKLKDMKKDELQKKLAILQENARVIRFKAEGSKSKNVKESATLRKEIARVLTEINNPSSRAKLTTGQARK